MLETFNPIALIFGSYALGTIGTLLIQKFGFYGSFENHNYIGDKLTKSLGVLVLGWVIRKSILGVFNKKLKFSGKLNVEKLNQLKTDMTFAENNHLIAFILLQMYIVFLACIGIEMWQIVSYTISNIIFNLYLVFLQQYNKRRIDKILRLKVN